MWIRHTTSNGFSNSKLCVRPGCAPRSSGWISSCARSRIGEHMQSRLVEFADLKGWWQRFQPVYLALALAGAALAQVKPPTTTVTGVVLDPSNALIPGTSVVLASGNKDLARSTTDEKGEFRLEVSAG